MNLHRQCPTCGEAISDKHICGQTVVCSCGWTHTYSTSLQKNKNSTVKFMILFSFLFVAAIFQITQWDTYAVSIVPLKLKEWTGFASVEDLKKIVEICSTRNKHDCVEAAYQGIYKLDPKDREVLAALGHFQIQRNKMEEASQTLGLYFDKKGESMEARYDYAKTLSFLGQYEKAIAYYKEVLKSKPDTFQITVTRAYVETLLKAGHWTKAKSTIEFYRRRSVSSSLFMNREYQEAKAQIASSRKVAKY